MDRYNISIPKPCDQKWEEMHPNERGRYCELCSKSVVDFTNKTHKETVRILTSAKKSVCGRFKKNQLERSIPLRRNENNCSLRTTIAGLLFFSSAINLASAQNQKYEEKAETTESITVGDVKQSNQKQNHDNLSKLDSLEGFVYDEVTLQPLAGATVKINGSNKLIITDIEGRFVVPLEETIEKATITLAYIGYKSQKINTKQLKVQQQFYLAEDAEALEAVVVTGGVHIVKRKHWWQFWKK